MSRSRRQTPIVGMASNCSMKWFRRQEHKRERAAWRHYLLNHDRLPEPHRKEFGNEWISPRDGKMYMNKEPSGWLISIWQGVKTREEIKQDLLLEYHKCMRK